MFQFVPFYVFVFFQSLFLGIGITIQATTTRLFHNDVISDILRQGSFRQKVLFVYTCLSIVTLLVYWLVAFTTIWLRKSFENVRTLLLFALGIQSLRLFGALLVFTLFYDVWTTTCALAFGGTSIYSLSSY